ncbi:MAG: efflux RND transporter periplasmic adaptor subunit [Flavobacteriales bacterium]|nr:efflux RND transporter periplasmic adaptor subunit [Flavobacteriales bacterium]
MLHRSLPIALLGLLACGPKPETITPQEGPITESIYASGAVKAEGQYQVIPSANGTVTALLVNKGDTVKAGQPLLRIDDRSSSAGARTADAQLRLLERNVREDGPVLTQLREAMEQARDRYAVDSVNHLRQQELWSKGIGSRNDLEQRELAFTTSKAALNRASKALDEIRERLRTELSVARNNAVISEAGNDDRTPRSLIDGIVYDLMIEPGELATTQRPVAVIGSATDLYLELEVDEYDITRVQVGQEAHITMDSFKGEVFPARITRIIPIMDERSRTFKVEARFTGTPPRLYPRLTAEASIVQQRKERALTIPLAYVVDDTCVLVGKTERRRVKLGLRDLERVEVLEGIDATTSLYKP